MASVLAKFILKSFKKLVNQVVDQFVELCNRVTDFSSPVEGISSVRLWEGSAVKTEGKMNVNRSTFGNRCLLRTR